MIDDAEPTDEFWELARANGRRRCGECPFCVDGRRDEYLRANAVQAGLVHECMRRGGYDEELGRRCERAMVRRDAPTVLADLERTLDRVEDPGHRHAVIAGICVLRMLIENRHMTKVDCHMVVGRLDWFWTWRRD